MSLKMQPEIVYVVTRSSLDGTFKVGDHIWLEENGDLSCREARGWIDADEVTEAIKGIQVKVDVDWMAKFLRKANRDLSAAIKLLTLCEESCQASLETCQLALEQAIKESLKQLRKKTLTKPKNR